jgi:hypothetical protein
MCLLVGASAAGLRIRPAAEGEKAQRPQPDESAGCGKRQRGPCTACDDWTGGCRLPCAY